MCENVAESEIIIRLGCCHSQSELGQPYELWNLNDPVNRMSFITSNESDTNLIKELEDAAVTCFKVYSLGVSEESRSKPQ